MPTETFFHLPEQKRRLVVDVAIDEFATHDYDAVSISRLVARSRIAKGSFYQYFTDKQDLYFHLLDLAVEKKLECLHSSGSANPRDGLFAYLKWLFQATVRFEFSYPELHRLANRALFGDATIRDEALVRMNEAGTTYYRQLLGLGMLEGEVDPDVDVDLAAFVLGTLLGTMGSYIISRAGAEKAEGSSSGEPDLDATATDMLLDEVTRILQSGLGLSGAWARN